MNKEKIIQKQQLRLMIYNFIAFSLIFALFGVIIYSQIQSSLFSLPDEELIEYQELITSSERFSPLDDDNRELSEDPIERGPNEQDRMASPRIVMIEWGEDGTIINQDQIGSLFYQSYLEDLQVDNDAESLNVIEPLTVDDVYQFRSLTFSNTEDTGVAYTQLLLNVDTEYQLLNRFEKLLIIVSIIFIVVSLVASYFLSKKTMQPIINSWDKQTEFVENASHELRTPLAIIKNKLELLLTSPQKKVVDVFENIALSLSETNRLSKLTSDLLTLARADSTATQLEKEKFDLDIFVEGVCAPYREIAQSQDKQINYKLKSTKKIVADKNRMHQLLVILLDNALKYTEEGDKIEVLTSWYDGYHEIVIKDTGIGLQSENLDHIFERFYREDKARSREQGGVGLGLSIAQWIVASHDGSISAKQNAPKGTVLHVRLP
ncbi:MULTISPECIES: cell wall metabolism sensor histidine kinase WalK [Paraliobacillus]|uniref:sensor histidine kinase n=1 Tax=Paraliobacillus TaxID=200903 RepID=UPI000DD43F12|nr:MULTISPECIES: HAMP domain-containing sensor histidine kinase [Paraliobacillus]